MLLELLDDVEDEEELVLDELDEELAHCSDVGLPALELLPGLGSFAPVMEAESVNCLLVQDCAAR